MPKEDWANNPVHEILRKNNLWPWKEVDTVLDVACGLSLKSKFLGAKNIVGVDVHEPYLRAIECEVPYSVLKYDVRKINEIFIDKSFDIVYALDIIEHLEKDESLALIDQCKKIGKKAVVVETPNGYIPQNLDIQGFDAHHLQTHRCAWEVSELEKLGFKCVIRPYKMSDVKRHTEVKVRSEIELIDGIFFI